MNLKNRVFMSAALACALAAPALAAHSGPGEDAVTAPPGAAAQTDHAPPVEASEPAHKAGAADGGAFDATKAVSTGRYVKPELKLPQRAAFGPKAGKAEEYAATREAAQDSGVTFKIFGFSAAFLLLITAGAAFSLSRTTKADGSPGRALTLGTKLAGGFGAVVTGIVVLAALSSRANTTIANAVSDAAHLSDQNTLINAMDGDMTTTRLTANKFRMSPNDENLAKYSDASATLAHKLNLTKQTIQDPERVKLVEALTGDVDEYARVFAEVVRVTDEREAIVDSQMAPAAARVGELLGQISSSAKTDADLETAYRASEARSYFNEMRVSLSFYLQTGDEKFVTDAGRTGGQFTTAIQQLGGLIKNPQRKVWLQETDEAAKFWIERLEGAHKLQEQCDELCEKSLDKIGPRMTKTSVELQDSLEKSKTDETAQADATAAAAKFQTAVVTGVIAVLGAALALVIARGVIKGLKVLESRLKDISQGEGDLTKRVDIKSRDEIGLVAQWFNVFVEKIERTVADVKSGAVQIDAGGSQIASASQSLAQGASEQASSLQQISASLEEISGQTQQSAENARQASTLAEENKKSADRGQQEMAQMSKAVNEIKQSSSEISKIIKVIDEIAFQTNLLALNAAVEAARAGEAGKGFAVVAEEVRNLAQRSAEAAKNTSSMIEESVKRSDNGVQIAVRVGQALEEITASTNKVNALLSEIASASSEQATGIGQINQGVSQLDQVTQQTAGNSEELASSAEEMSAQVASLNELVAQFKVSGSGLPRTQRPAPLQSKQKQPAPSQPVKKAVGKGLHPAGATLTPAKKNAHSVPTPEQVIPMDNDDVLASF